MTLHVKNTLLPRNHQTLQAKPGLKPKIKVLQQHGGRRHQQYTGHVREHERAASNDLLAALALPQANSRALHGVTAAKYAVVLKWNKKTV
jgi:hypothetical protein